MAHAGGGEGAVTALLRASLRAALLRAHSGSEAAQSAGCEALEWLWYNIQECPDAPADAGLAGNRRRALEAVVAALQGHAGSAAVAVSQEACNQSGLLAFPVADGGKLAPGDSAARTEPLRTRPQAQRTRPTIAALRVKFHSKMCWGGGMAGMQRSCTSRPGGCGRVRLLAPHVQMVIAVSTQLQQPAATKFSAAQR